MKIKLPSPYSRQLTKFKQNPLFENKLKEGFQKFGNDPLKIKQHFLPSFAPSTIKIKLEKLNPNLKSGRWGIKDDLMLLTYLKGKLPKIAWPLLDKESIERISMDMQRSFYSTHTYLRQRMLFRLKLLELELSKPEQPTPDQVLEKMKEKILDIRARSVDGDGDSYPKERGRLSKAYIDLFKVAIRKHGVDYKLIHRDFFSDWPIDRIRRDLGSFVSVSMNGRWSSHEDLILLEHIRENGPKDFGKIEVMSAALRGPRRWSRLKAKILASGQTLDVAIPQLIDELSAKIQREQETLLVEIKTLEHVKEHGPRKWNILGDAQKEYHDAYMRLRSQVSAQKLQTRLSELKAMYKEGKGRTFVPIWKCDHANKLDRAIEIFGNDAVKIQSLFFPNWPLAAIQYRIENPYPKLGSASVEEEISLVEQFLAGKHRPELQLPNRTSEWIMWQMSRIFARMGLRRSYIYNLEHADRKTVERYLKSLKETTTI